MEYYELNEITVQKKKTYEFLVVKSTNVEGFLQVTWLCWISTGNNKMFSSFLYKYINEGNK